MNILPTKRGALVLLVALAVGVWLWASFQGGAEPNEVSRPSGPVCLDDLAPSDTQLYLEVTGPTEAIERLEAAASNPEQSVQADFRPLGSTAFAVSDVFFGSPRTYINRRQLPLLHKFKSIEPERLFCAGRFPVINGLPNSFRFVGGVSYRGKLAQAEALRAEMKAALLRRWPGATSQLSEIAGMQVESIKSTPTSFQMPIGSPKECHMAFCKNWIFVATDEAMLRDTLERFQNPQGKKRLADNPDFSRDFAKLPATHGAKVWGDHHRAYVQTIGW